VQQMPGRDAYLDGLLGDRTYDLRNSSGSLAMLAAMRRASSRVSSLAIKRMIGAIMVRLPDQRWQ
jgi:hypothetical protein